MPLNLAFGYAVRDMRESKDWSQEELAECCGFDRTAISLIERGKRTPRLDTMYGLACGLETTLVELMELTYKYLQGKRVGA